MAAAGDRYWVPHPDLAFAACTFQGTEGKDAKFADDEGTVITISADKFAELPRVQGEQLEGVDNVCNLEEVNQAALLNTVRARYHRAQCHIYTRVSRIMIAVNPFKALPIYSGETMRKYLECRDSMDLPPHLFAVGQDAILGLRGLEGQNQAVLISGESGAGKTESTKLVLSYIAAAVGGSSGEGGIQDKVMQTNPILESFGNAMTVRNNNSSRFGKWLEMSIANGTTVQGCSVTDYLLELTRVITQGEKERNYHIFFQMFEAKEELKDLNVGGPADYQYTKHAVFKAPNVNDRKFFEELVEAFDGLGFDKTAQMDVFKIVVGILELSNCEFEGEDSSKLKDQAPVGKAAKLFGLDAAQLEKSMLVKSLMIGKDVTEKPNTPALASGARDSLSRLLYGRLFKLLVRRINALLSGGAATKQWFGVLDIAGFESFEKNSLEQLFINLSNEHLQGHFNNHVFKSELADYQAEGISLDGCMDFQDNSDIIALLDSKGSLLAILDEEVSMPKASDATFMAKLCKAHEKHVRFAAPKFAGGTTFGIRHFAGEVTYSVESFLEKNIDKPPDEAPKLFQSSSNGVVKEIGDDIAADVAEAAAAGGGGKKKAKTVSSSFRTSLGALITKLNEAAPHFVRCIKPNAEKVPDKFTSKLVMEQLNCSGVFEAVRIRQSGFASRVLFKDFIGRYRIIAPIDVQKKVFGKGAMADTKAAAKLLVDSLPAALKALGGGEIGNDILLGKSKVFCRSKVVGLMDKARDRAVASFAITIQKVFRGHRVRKMVKTCYVVFDEVKAWEADNPFYKEKGAKNTALAKLSTPDAIEAQCTKLDELLRKAEPLPLTVPRKNEVMQVRDRMRQECDAVKGMKAALGSTCPIEIEKALLRSKDLELPPNKDTEKIKDRLANLKIQVPLVKAIEKAIEEDDMANMEEVMTLIKKQQLHQHPERWIKELEGEEKAGELFNIIQMKKAKEHEEHAKSKLHEELAGTLQKEILATKQVLQKDEAFEEKMKKKQSDKKPTRGKRVTITGLTMEEKTRIMMDLEKACDAYDLPGIEQGLNDAMMQAIDENTTVKRARDLFESLSSKDAVVREIEDKKAELNINHGDQKVLRQLQNLCKQAETLGVDPSLLEEARKETTKVVRSRMRQTIKGQIFEHIDVAEFDLADGAFADLNNFSRLKHHGNWKGHSARKWYDLFGGKAGEEHMLKHGKHAMRSALTKVEACHESIACDTYYNILCWMGDKAVSEIQREPLLTSIVETAASEPDVTDEVYVQLMKQLTENPSSRGMARGWELMLSLCQHACPSNELHEYLHVFLMKAVTTATPEIAYVIRQCIADLNLTASPDKLKEENVIAVSVMLVDYSQRKVRVSDTSTLKHLAQATAQQLRISKPDDFAIFMATEGMSTHRILPDNAQVNQLQSKWKTLKEKTGRNASFMMKRRLLGPDESLNPGDFAHANLTYRQALWDYLHYPIVDADFYGVAGAVVWADRDHFKRFIDKGYMKDDDVLEQVLPEAALANKGRTAEVAKVLNKFMELRASTDEKESKLLGMSRAFAEMQKLKLFGAWVWHGRQLEVIPKGKHPLEGKAPEKHCKVNPKASAKTDYVICVDCHGLTFVAQSGDSMGACFHRCFAFNDEAVERVMLWGAKETVAAFVVSAVDPRNPAAGRTPMTVAVECAAAVDIAYAVHMIHMIKAGQQF